MSHSQKFWDCTWKSNKGLSSVHFGAQYTMILPSKYVDNL